MKGLSNNLTKQDYQFILYTIIIVALIYLIVNKKPHIAVGLRVLPRFNIPLKLTPKLTT